MIKLLSSLIPKPWLIVGVLAVAASAYASLMVYGNVKYNEGADDAVKLFLKADLEGANNVRDTANKILDDISGNTDFIGMLTDNNGLRD